MNTQKNKIDKSNRFKKFFPFFKKNKIIYLDSAATTLKPIKVIKDISFFYTNFSLNTHSIIEHKIFRDIEKKIILTRKCITDVIGGNSYDEVVFFSSATIAINILILSLIKYIGENDNIISTFLEHSSVCFPMQFLSKKTGARLLFLDLNSSGYINIDKISKYVDKNTKFVSIIHTSNSIGITNNIENVVSKIRYINSDCLILVDCCQSIVNDDIFAHKWDIDFLVFSAHKIYGPTGLGVLWINKNSNKNIEHILWGGGKKISPLDNKNFQWDISYYNNWEVGSLPLEQIFGLFSSLNWFKKNKKNIKENIYNLKKYALEKLSEIKNIIIYNKDNINKEKNGIITFNILNYNASDISNLLAKNNIFVRSGDFCCPYIKNIINTTSAVRISLGCYNDKSDIDKLVFFLNNIKKNFSLYYL